MALLNVWGVVHIYRNSQIKKKVIYVIISKLFSSNLPCDKCRSKKLMIIARPISNKCPYCTKLTALPSNLLAQD